MTYVIEDIFERHMKGKSENIELMFRRVYWWIPQRPDPTIIGAFSGLEIALGYFRKSCGKPIFTIRWGNAKKMNHTPIYPFPHIIIKNSDLIPICG